MGTRVVVVSSDRTGDSTVADELRRQADEFVELAAIAEFIKMPDRPTVNPNPENNFLSRDGNSA